MKIIAVDYGDARTGIAMCDKNEILASPYTVLHEKDRAILVKKICDIIHEENIEKAIIGLPRNMDGSYGYRCDECRELGNLLGEVSGIPVFYQDERLTTVIANNLLTQNNVNAKKRKASVDALSAVLILESYLDSRK